MVPPLGGAIVRTNFGVGFRSKVYVTVLPASTVTSQVFAVPPQALPQWPSWWVASGTALSVTCVSSSRSTEQVAGQSMPPPETRPPAEAFTVSRALGVWDT